MLQGSETLPRKKCQCPATVDGRNPASQFRLIVYPSIYWVLYIPGGCLGFLNHQQYHA